MSSTTLTLLLAILLSTTLISSISAREFATNSPGNDYGVPEFGNGIPGVGTGNGWAGGYGGGYSGPNGGRSWSGVSRPTTTCKEKGACYKKKLTCPAKCFKSWSKSGKNYGGGGGQGGCTLDCKKCVAYC